MQKQIITVTFILHSSVGIATSFYSSPCEEVQKQTHKALDEEMLCIQKNASSGNDGLGKPNLCASESEKFNQQKSKLTDCLMKARKSNEKK